MRNLKGWMKMKKKQIQWASFIVLVLALIVACVVGYDRYKVEDAQKKYDIAIKYTDVLKICRQNNLSYEEVLKDLKDTGVNVLLVTENKIISDGADNLASYKAQGKATCYTGYDLLREDKENTDIIPQYNYIWCLDETTQKDIYEYLTYSGYTARIVTINNQDYIETPTTTVLTTVGVGYNEADLKTASEYGFIISPQIASRPYADEEGMKYVVERLKELPNLGPIYFNDSDVTCFSNDEMHNLLQEYGAGFIEFFSNKQSGFSKLVEDSSQNYTNFNMYRLHTLTDGEVDKYEGRNLYERFELALTERNISYFLFKLPKKYAPEANYELLKQEITGFREVAAQAGYTQGDVTPLNFKPQSYVKTFLIGLATIAVFILICSELNLQKLGLALAAIGCIGYALLLKKNMLLGSQMMGLFTTLCFPTYAMLKGLQFKKGSILECAKGLTTSFLIALSGAIVFVGIMARTEFALGIEMFRGVKFSFILPILLVVGILMYQYKMLKYSQIEEWSKMSINYLVVAIMGVFAIILWVYISRSGNSGTAGELEIQIRQVLKNVFGTRPRTKEFLISYPIIVSLIYYGYHKLYIPLTALATVGMVSVVNTFTHVHTPVIISLKRAGWGLVLGFILGVILIYIVQIGLELFNRIQTSEKK